MTNFEYYKDKILEIGDIKEIALTKDGELGKCSELDCGCCKFHRTGDCNTTMIEWLYMEHVEKKPKLTKKEYELCALLHTGYIAKDRNGAIGYYRKKPSKASYDYVWSSGFGWCNFTDKALFVDIKFDFIKWEDEEPWSVEELLKLEVE